MDRFQLDSRPARMPRRIPADPTRQGSLFDVGADWLPGQQELFPDLDALPGDQSLEEITTMLTERLHRDIFPYTDHGYTWVETIWWEDNGERISPMIPAGACNERLGQMPGGPMIDRTQEERAFYVKGRLCRVRKTETIHQGRYRVGSVCIDRID